MGRWKKGCALPDLEQIKARVRETEEIRQVDSHYDKFRTEGIAQKLVRSHAFEGVTLVVIALNVLWMWIHMDYNSGSWLFQVPDQLFCAFYCFELAIQFKAYKCKCDAFRNRWFVFNAFLVCQMVFETWIMLALGMMLKNNQAVESLGNLKILRLARLTRLFRLARFMRAMPELLFMFKGIIAATRSVGLTLGMLVCLLFVVGMTMKQLSEGTSMGSKYFPNVLAAMYNLSMHGAFLDNVAEVMSEVCSESWLCGLFFAIFIIAAALTLMNMLVGVLCDVMGAVAQKEKEKLCSALSLQRSSSSWKTWVWTPTATVSSP